MAVGKFAANGAPPPLYIVSGGSGTSGRLIVETALAQFATVRPPVVVVAGVRTVRQVEAAVEEAGAGGGAVVHTLVNGRLRKALVRHGRRRGVATIDLMGPLLELVSGQTGAKPLGQPGLYRKLRKDYFDRVEAIDFAVSHDDGNRPGDMALADAVIVGVSRCGKTPLSMYLAVHGWKVANIPIVKGIPMPEALFRIDRRRVIGLGIDLGRLLEYRRKREEVIGKAGMTAYSSRSAVLEELELARTLFRKGRFAVVEVTDKPVEIIAGEVIRLITRNPAGSRRRPVPS